jgi:hypothetical protein
MGDAISEGETATGQEWPDPEAWLASHRHVRGASGLHGSENATLTVMGSIRRKLTHPKSKQDLLFRNQSTGKALSDRIWRDSLQEMLVESGLTTLAEGDSNDLRKTEIASGKNLTWYSFRHTWITFALERGVPIATVCNNCDTSIQYVQEHYFHSDAKRATDALSTGRGQLKGATGNG